MNERQFAAAHDRWLEPPDEDFDEDFDEEGDEDFDEEGDEDFDEEGDEMDLADIERQKQLDEENDRE